MPRIEQLHQNTPDWHRWRQQGIGASDAPVIMGDGAFKTPAHALVDKDRKDAGRRGRVGGAARSRDWSGSPAGSMSSRPAPRWSRFAWCTTNWNGCVHRSMV